MSQPSIPDAPNSTPPRLGKLKRLSIRMLKLLVISYVLLCLLVYVAQSRMVFPGSCAPTAAARYAPPTGSTPLTLHTEDGTQIAGLFCRAFVDGTQEPTSRPADCPTIIYCYGNGQTAAWSLYEIDLFRRCGANVLVADYPGYGLSMGSPSEQGCYQTADALWTYATHSADIDPHRLVAVGWSLGGAVAINLARNHPLQGLMTVSTFTHMRQVAQERYWFLPATWLLRYDFASDQKLPSITCPTVIVHGQADTLIPLAMSRDLLAISPASWKRYIAVPGAGHNDVFAAGYEPIRAALTELLQTVDHSPRPLATTSPSVP